MASTSPYSFGKLQMKLLNSTREIAYGVGTLIVLGAGVYGYVYYKEQARDAAQVVLAQALDDMKKAQEGGTEWSDVELAAIAGYKNHPSTAISDYFGAIKAQALLRQNKYEQALAAIDETVKKLSPTNYLHDLYAILKARMMLRLENNEQSAQAINTLTSISQSTKSMFQDMALYYLHEHYKAVSEIEKAASMLNQLKSRFTNPEAPSPWALLAEQA